MGQFDDLLIQSLIEILYKMYHEQVPKQKAVQWTKSKGPKVKLNIDCKEGVLRPHSLDYRGKTWIFQN